MAEQVSCPVGLPQARVVTDRTSRVFSRSASLNAACHFHAKVCKGWYVSSHPLRWFCPSRHSTRRADSASFIDSRMAPACDLSRGSVAGLRFRVRILLSDGRFSAQPFAKAAGEAVKVKITGATYAAFLMISRRVSFLGDGELSMVGTPPQLMCGARLAACPDVSSTPSSRPRCSNCRIVAVTSWRAVSRSTSKAPATSAAISPILPSRRCIRLRRSGSLSR